MLGSRDTLYSIDNDESLGEWHSELFICFRIQINYALFQTILSKTLLYFGYKMILMIATMMMVMTK